MKQFQHFFWVPAVALLLALAPACNASKTAKGAAIGGAAGGVIGGVIGKSSGNTAAGIIIGSAVGGTAGAVIGDYMDRQAKEIEQEVEGAEVARVGEGILVTFDSGLLFGFDSYALTATTRENLSEMADILNKYPDTDITIEGHTDSKGTEAYNQTLSERRAAAVADYLSARGVSRSRMTTNGYGEMRPVATNETDAGRAQNRRVEVAIVANEALQQDAEDGQIDN
jgi:outer membrane protein OmpA-like peptidoglycan-associated protein